MDALARKLTENVGDEPTRPSLELTPHGAKQAYQGICYGCESFVASITRSFGALVGVAWFMLKTCFVFG